MSLQIISNLEKLGAEGVILGCTEIQEDCKIAVEIIKGFFIALFYVIVV
jgi:aspartate/glutamate racemase